MKADAVRRVCFSGELVQRQGRRRGQAARRGNLRPASLATNSLKTLDRQNLLYSALPLYIARSVWAAAEVTRPCTRLESHSPRVRTLAMSTPCCCASLAPPPPGILHAKISSSPGEARGKASLLRCGSLPAVAPGCSRGSPSPRPVSCGTKNAASRVIILQRLCRRLRTLR